MITKDTIQQLQKIAMKVSKQSNYRYKLGAVIFSKNKIISVGINQIKTNPKLFKYFKYATVHAEVDAVLHAVQDVSDCDIYVYRETRNGKVANAKPCPQCVQFLKENGINRAYWTTAEFPFFDYDTIDNLYNKIDKRLAYIINKYPDDPNIPRIFNSLRTNKESDLELLKEVMGAI